MSGVEHQPYLQENNRFPSCKMNDDANLYHNSNSVQMTDAIICLKEYIPKIKWNDSESRIVDIGCGDGSVTNMIKKLIPQNYKELIGCDIHERMVNFANENYKNEKMLFRVLDIEDTLPEDFVDRFNHVFSFYTMHWIQNQEKAFTNIYNMLSNDGDCVLAFLAYMPIYTAFWAVASTKKWKKWIPNCKGFMSPYHNLQEPEKHITIMLQKIGFKNTEVTCKQMHATYSVQSLKDTVRSINPYPIPKEIFDEFLEDYVLVMRDMRMMDNVHQEVEVSDLTTAIIPYNLMVVYATKS